MKRSRTIMLVSNTARSFILFRRHLISDLISQGFRVVCVAAPDEYSTEIQSLGAVFRGVQMDRSGMNPWIEARCLGQLAALLRRERPALVITYTIKPNTYVPVLARVLGVPVLAVITGLGYAYIDLGIGAKIARALMRIGTGFANHIWALNDDDVQTLRTHHIPWARRIHVIPGEGVDTAYFAPRPGVPHTALHFLLSARVLIDKGVREYAQAAAKVHQTCPDVQFHMIGAIDPGNPNAIPPEEWQNILKQGHLIYHGTTHDVRSYIAQADCVVLPSYREGVPLVLLEGAAMAKPLIATDVPGCRDVVKEGRNGLLCRAGDAADLARAMMACIAMRAEQRAQMGQNARHHVIAQYDISIILDHYRHFITQNTGS